MREEEVKLRKEIEKRTREKKVRNMRAIRIQAMRDFLRKMPPEEEDEVEEAIEEECERKTREMIKAMDEYNRTTTGNKCTTDSFTVYEDNGEAVCDVTFTMVIRNRRPENDVRKLKYQILYEVSDENVTRICGVVDKNLIRNEQKTNSAEQASSSGIGTLEESKPAEKEEQGTTKKGDETPVKKVKTAQTEERRPWGRTTQEERLKINSNKKRPRIVSDKILKIEVAEDLRKKLDFHRRLKSQLARKMQPPLSNGGACSTTSGEETKRAPGAAEETKGEKEKGKCEGGVGWKDIKGGGDGEEGAF